MSDYTSTDIELDEVQLNRYATDPGLDEDDYVQLLFDQFGLKVRCWAGLIPSDKQWLDTYGLYADLHMYLGSEAMREAWALAKAGDPDWTELRKFGKERDRRKEARPETKERRKRWRRKPETKERERLRAAARRAAAKAAKEAA